MTFELFDKSATTARAVAGKVHSENISKVLYPERRDGRRARSCRLKQQYFFVSCSLHELIIRCSFRIKNTDWRHASTIRFAIQLNDTHPVVAIAEMIRILRRRVRFEMGHAPGKITRKDASAYTCHTPAARGVGDSGRCRLVRQKLLAAASGDYLRDQCAAFSTKRLGKAYSGRRRRPHRHACRFIEERDTSGRFAWPTWHACRQLSPPTAWPSCTSRLLRGAARYRDFAEMMAGRGSRTM